MGWITIHNQSGETFNIVIGNSFLGISNVASVKDGFSVSCPVGEVWWDVYGVPQRGLIQRHTYSPVELGEEQPSAILYRNEVIGAWFKQHGVPSNAELTIPPREEIVYYTGPNATGDGITVHNKSGLPQLIAVVNNFFLNEVVRSLAHVPAGGSIWMPSGPAFWDFYSYPQLEASVNFLVASLNLPTFKSAVTLTHLNSLATIDLGSSLETTTVG